MRTKIVATVGPASGSEAQLTALLKAGVDVFRLNFSHGTHDQHREWYGRIRRLAEELDLNVCILQDLQGPKIRTGEMKDGQPVSLRKGERTVITTRKVQGTAERFSCTYRGLARDVQRGDRVLLDDGNIELRVTSTTEDSVRCKVVIGGELGEHKGINLPGVNVTAPALTRKDRRDLAFGLDLGVDAVALSFARRAADIEAAQRLIARHDSDAPVIAKIEKPEAIDELDAILDCADGVMVARGDLGVEMRPEAVPVLQKQIIRQANRRGKPVIVATQMLESMIDSPRPTRAEASDVANAIFDRTDAVMLSGETAIGRYPTRAVQMMTRIAEAAEQVVPHGHDEGTEGKPPLSIPAAIADAGVHAADDIQAAALFVFTMSGATARLLAERRPACAIHAFSPVAATRHRLAMVWGVEAHPVRRAEDVAELLEEAVERLKKAKVVHRGDALVLVAGTTPLPGATNAIKVLRVE
ncbi:MAG: pyruvate kinase [Planctomycetota bacterium]